MIEQVIGWVVLLQNYCISLCHNISYHVKRLGSLTLSSGEAGVCKKIDNCQRLHSYDDSNKIQTLNKKARFKSSSEIPGPKCLPVIGSLFEFNKFGARRIHELAVDRHEQYGDIFREKLLSQEMVFLANTSLMKEWMAQEGKMPNSTKQEPSNLFAEECPQFKRGLFFRDGVDWLRLRKTAHACLLKNASEFGLDGLFEACESFMDDELEELRDIASQPENNGWIDDFEILCYKIVVQAIMSVVYGKSYKKFRAYTGVELAQIHKNAFEINIHNQDLVETPVRLLKWLGLPTWKEYRDKLAFNLGNAIGFTQRLRDDIMESPESASLKSYGLLFKMMQINCPTSDADDLLVDFAIDTKDPLAGSFMFVNQVLGMVPDIQQNIYKEVARVYPDNEPITYSKSKDLLYTEAFFKEVLRIFPIAPFTSRVATEETIVGGYLLRPGTIINYSSYVAHRDPRYFSDPLKILPERWLSKEYLDKHSLSDSLPTQPTCDPIAFASFGLKQRTCIGQNIANSIFVLWTAKLVRKFRVTSKEFPRDTMRTVLYPTNPGPIHLQPR